jgi:hypothetical protein
LDRIEREAYREKQKHRARDAHEELEWLKAVAASSLKGAFGLHVRDEAREVLLDGDRVRTDEHTLRHWLAQIRLLDWQSHADATKRLAR